jgi:hypothetical protein
MLSVRTVHSRPPLAQLQVELGDRGVVTLEDVIKREYAR